MNDARPLPEYGEYATDAEQAEAMGVMREPVLEQPAPPVVPVAPAPPVVTRRRWDLVITIALIVIGAYVTVSGFATYSDLPYSLSQVYSMYGYDGQYSGTDQTRSIGTIINIVQPVLLIVAVFLSSRSLRAGRVTFWIPLTAGIVAGITSTGLLTMLLLSDSGFVAFMTTMVG